ncbi:uncharacterized protein VTP21DRAFT_11616 [Calcarisporiella thermophila]|uniref:uncharacterized protein n=1 Tax=Calcarisporiella thermophila TaxID=911321 RepID=UPI0037445E8B
MSRPKLAVLISGYGSNLQALIDATRTGDLPADIALVVSNRTKAYGLTRAKEAGIPTLIFPLKPYRDAGKSRSEYDADLADKIASQNPDLIVLAGWMHILSPEFLSRFPTGNVINLHPALPGQFDGANAIGRAFEAFQRGEIKETGVMVHQVIAEVDQGEPILVESVPILEKDTLESLEERIHAVEHRLIVQGTKKFLERANR